MASLRGIYGAWVVEVWVGEYLEPISPCSLLLMNVFFLRLDSLLGGPLFFVFYVLLLGLIC